MKPTLIVTAVLGLAMSAWAQSDTKSDPKAAEKAIEKAAEDKAKARIAEFRKGLKPCRTPEEFATALDGLGDEPHTLILNELKMWLARPDVTLRTAAAKEIGKFKKDAKAAGVLLATAQTEKDGDVAFACLSGIEDINCRASVKNIPTLYKHGDIDVAKKAVEVTGDFGTKEAIEILINHLFKLEGEKRSHSTNDASGIQNGPALGSSEYGKQAGQAMSASERIEAMLVTTRKALMVVTKQPLTGSMQYKEWWAKAKANWQDPEEDSD